MVSPEAVVDFLLTLRGRFLDRLYASRPIGVSYNPYDRAACEELAERLLHLHDKEQPLGTIGRSRLLLRIIGESFPTRSLTAAYFQNLEHIFRARERRSIPGQVLLGLGTGRSGSTSLTAMLATVPASCCTHENPPLIFWSPLDAQLEFHMKRFNFLAQYYSLVADVSHWWLNALDRVFQHFPDSKVVGTFRDVDTCAKSFMRIKGYGRRSWNHWAPYGNGVWASHSWDPTYPTFLVSGNSSNPDHLKYELISRYVQEYNDRLKLLAARLPNRVMVVRTEELNDAAVQMRLFDFAGVNGRVTKLNLNVRNVADGLDAIVKF